jgi:hypothetical protein
MRNQNRNAERGGGWIISAGIVMLLPVLYVLSIGPVVFLRDRCYLPGADSIMLVYYPLDWSASASPALTHLFNSYLELWIVQKRVARPAPPPPAIPLKYSTDPSANSE